MALSSLAWIIPARAGFTSATRKTCATRSDHPRSRGVYRHPELADLARAGSSPLARGLHVVLTAFQADRMDHPRSRGVYAPDEWRPGRAAGSSPLARGLHPGPDARAVVDGIIPARAGFTVSRPHSSSRSSDHPRSRGVYRHQRVRGGGVGGSSPLARGLPHGRDVVGHERRIIPARAGFTECQPRTSRAPWDHPRSRGVYTCGSLVSQRTRSLPDPRRLHCRPRARSAGSP